MFVREHTRYAVELAIRMKCATWADYLELHTSNLSRGGLFVPSSAGGARRCRARDRADAARTERGAAARRGRRTSAPQGGAARRPGRHVRRRRRRGPRCARGGAGGRAGAGAEAAAAAAAAASAADGERAKAPVANPRRRRPPPGVRRRRRRRDAGERAKAPVAPPPLPRVPRFADAVEHALVDELARRLDLPPHEQLGVTAEVGDAELEEAHRHLKERYAPSIFARYGSSTAATVKSINDAIDQAYRRLRDPSERRALVIAAHQPKARRAVARRAGAASGAARRRAPRCAPSIERRFEEACAHRDMNRIDDAVRVFEQVLEPRSQARVRARRADPATGPQGERKR